MEGLGIADYIVFVFMLLISGSIGIYYRFSGGKQKTTEEYIHGSQSMGMIPVAFSLMASFMSAITLLGVSNENYTFGTQFTIINFGYIISTPVCAYLYLPVFYRLKCNSVYEYLEKRFEGKIIRLVASLAFTLQAIMYMGIVLYAPALSLSAITGISYIGSLIAVGVCCTIYSTLGGIKAVLITDVFQSLMMFGSLIAVIIIGVNKVGGITNIYEASLDGDRIEFFNMSVDPTVRHTFWTQLIGGIFTAITIYGVNQSQVQRLLTIGSLKRSQGSLWIQWPIMASLSFLTSFAGLTMYTYYKDCDPVQSKRIPRGDQLLALFVMDTMSNYYGITGLFVAGIFSGSLSTVSSSINSLAAVSLEDYIKPLVKVPPKMETLVLKFLVLFYGVLSIILAFLCEFLPSGILQASLTIFGIVGGPLLGLFTLGIFTRRGNEIGALIGLISSLALLIWMAFGGPRPKIDSLPVSIDGCPMNITTHLLSQTKYTSEEYFYLYEISYAWYSTIGAIWTFVVGYVVSLFTQKCSKVETQSKYLFQWKNSSLK
ncbi:putative sodium-dependent multivitamin transporter [Lepeophtheirus salmonis]|uniref:putative sodium-dependent multivitamin transporter n=1 Tax=Lepeophtheirus salmonis TaxID=72036 RepID=UPI001AEB1DD8|nr:putative sodium-dependent multivitamin transporter [Lepeophtheirus salmonis]